MGFLTVLIWINVAAQVIQNVGRNWNLTIVYAAGYAAGQATGMWVEGRIALGHQLVACCRARGELARALGTQLYVYGTGGPRQGRTIDVLSW